MKDVKYCPFVHGPCMDKNCMMYVEEKQIYDDVSIDGTVTKRFRKDHCALNTESVKVRETREKAAVTDEVDNSAALPLVDEPKKVPMMSIWNG